MLTYLRNIEHAADEYARISRDILGQLGYGDIKEMSEYIGDCRKRYGLKPDELSDLAVFWLQKRGADIPGI